MRLEGATTQATVNRGFTRFELARAEAAEVRVARLEEAARLALSGIPDPMHPGIPRKFVDKLVAAQIILMDASGHDDPGNVESAREVLAGVSVEPQK